MDIIGAMLKIVCSMVLGFFLYKKKVLNDDTNSAMSRLITLCVAPCMLFSSLLSLGSNQKQNILVLLLAGVGMYVIFALIAFIVVKIIRPGKSLAGTYEAVMVFGNSAFLGFPVGQALMGDIGVSYLAILNIHQNIFCWTYGVYLLTKGSEGKARFTFKKLLNPPNIAALIALILYFLNISLPDIVMTPIEFIGDICSPLSMIVMGATIASFPLKNLFTNWRYYILSVVKLIVFPFAILACALPILGATDLTRAMIIHSMMPTAVVINLAAIMYGAHSETTSAVGGLTDIICVGSIPLVWAVVNILLG